MLLVCTAIYICKSDICGGEDAGNCSRKHPVMVATWDLQAPRPVLHIPVHRDPPENCYNGRDYRLTHDSTELPLKRIDVCSVLNGRKTELLGSQFSASLSLDVQSITLK